MTKTKTLKSTTGNANAAGWWMIRRSLTVSSFLLCPFTTTTTTTTAFTTSSGVRTASVLLAGSSGTKTTTASSSNHHHHHHHSWNRVESSSTTTRMFSTTMTNNNHDNNVCTTTDNNPLLSDWSNQPFLLPPFDVITPSHFESALEHGMEQHTSDLDQIIANPEPPTFDNTIAAYDRAGRVLERVALVYSNMCSSLNTPELQSVQTKMAPILSRHESSKYQKKELFDKIETVYRQIRETTTSLTPEQVRLTERIYLDFTRAGAALNESEQQELADINAELASLTTKFTQKVMKDEEEVYLTLSLDDLKGCPDFLVQAAQTAAKERGKAEDEYVITLSRSLVEPFLTFCDNRELRKQAFELWTRRGELGNKEDDDNNKVVAVQILKLRKRIAEIHGYTNFAAYQCADRMAQTPEKVMELLENVWERAKVVANAERQAMEDFVNNSSSSGGDEASLPDGIQAYDWRYYAEKVRQAKYDFDESLLKPYLSLENVREALFAVSEKLFGLTYEKIMSNDVAVYHPDVDLYKVIDSSNDNKLVSLFIHDNFARPYKSSGAWMSEYRGQTRNLPSDALELEGIPVISNNNNFAKGSDTTLLSFDDAKTMFHEFGHAHHGMLSDATYSRLAGTNVLTDFVELPSQLMEHWFDQRQVLQKYARHYQTGEPVPDELLDKLESARLFQQGFQTVEYSACALLDMALHQVEDYTDFDMDQFERDELQRLGMPAAIVMRHRPAHFQHLFSTNMYAAGYYVYQWAEVLDADAFAAFEETGDVFDSETAAKCRKFIYSAGNTQAPDELFRQFRGRDPDIKFMLKEKGLL